MKKNSLLAVLLLITAVTNAQLAETEYLTKKADATSSNEFFADFDNNGVIDFFLVVPSIVEINPGSPNGYQIPLNAPISFLSMNCIADMNNDGFLDIVANQTAGLVIFFNQAGQSFTPFEVNLGSNFHSAGHDYNGDGSVDIVYGVNVYLNDGSGQNFTNSNYSIGSAYDLFLDWNNDGIKDLIRYNGNNMTIRYGQGGLSYAAPSNFIFNSSTISPISSTFQDYDSDGDLDFLLLSNNIKAYVNDGTGGISASNSTIVSNSGEFYISCGDFDGNGQWDVLGRNLNNVFIRFNFGTLQFDTPKVLGSATNYLSSPGSNTSPSSYFLNDFNGDEIDEVILNITVFGVKYWFTYDTSINGPSNQNANVIYSSSLDAPVFRDFNGDGNLDIICMADQKAQVLYQTSSNTKIQGREHFFIYPGFIDVNYNYSYGDFNEDGWQDMVYSHFNLGIKMVVSNQGVIDTTNAITVSEGSLSSVRIFDINEDGHLDILHDGIFSGGVAVYYGDGEGSFTNLESPEEYSWGATLFPQFYEDSFFDFDNNGWTDILMTECRIAYQMSQNQFSYDEETPIYSNGYTSVGHFDNNGYIDFIYQNTSFNYYIALNNGFNNISEGVSVNSLLGANVSMPTFIDYDGDGDEDIIGYLTDFGNGPYTYNVYVNNGNGTWTTVPLGLHKTRSFQVVDWDRDGDEDVLFFYDSTTNAVSDIDKGIYWLQNLSTTQYAVTGVIYYDENQNGVKDEVETTTFGFNQTSSSSGDYGYTQNTGNYTIYHELAGTYTITTLAPNGFIFTTPSEFSIELTNEEPTVTNIDFGVYPAAVFTAGEADLVAFSPICDSQGAVFIQLTNTGTQNVPVEITFELPDYSSFMGSSIDTPSTTDSTLIWAFDELEIGSSINIPFFIGYPNVDFIDSIFTYIYTIQIGDVTLTDTLQLNMLCAYDPNIKVEQIGWGPQGYFLDGQTLEYIVYFQNTGNYLATNVRLEDQITNLLDASSIDVVSASHNIETSLSDTGLLTFYFPNIMLPDSASDPLGSIGYVKFRINHAPSVEPGDVIENLVNIFFDFNPPITTNTEINTMYDCELEGDNIPNATVQIAGNVLTANEGFDYEWFVNNNAQESYNQNTYTASFAGNYQVRVIDPNGCSELSNQISVTSIEEGYKTSWNIYPNPTTSRFVVTNLEGANVPLVIYDMMGKKIMSLNVSNKQEINVNDLSAGIYVIQIGDKQRRLVVK
ncbi:MAG: FG-GAP-like repeat-containing protein [Flavobacteriales bacterium]